MEDDSPLSIAANIIGIITFVLAIAAAAYARWLWLKSRIALPYELLTEYEKVDIFIWGMRVLYSEADFISSPFLRKLLVEVYQDQIEAAREMWKMQLTTALERIGRANSARFFEIYGRVEYKMGMLRNMYAREQIGARFARLEKQVPMQTIEDPDLSQGPNPDYSDSAAVELRKNWRRMWEESLDRVRMALSASDLIKERHMRFGSFDHFLDLVDELIKQQQRRAFVEHHRFFSYV